MYTDFLDHLTSNGGGGSSGGTSSSNSNERPLVAFKAGKMKLTLQENGNYWAEPDTRRGEIRLVWKNSDSNLHFQWYDRREKQIASTSIISNSSGTMERVTNVPSNLVSPGDRLYVWTQKTSEAAPPEYEMFWMQDASEEQDDELIAQVNQYLADPASANPAATSTASNNTEGNEGNSSSNNGNETVSASATAARVNSTVATSRQQVDALSNILENLGMPQNDVAAGSSSVSTNNATSTTTPGALTLADLQGAMAGLSQPQQSAGPPLEELVTPGAISSLLENEAVRNRLLEFLPEAQRSPEYLEENLRSPQIQQTLRSLTVALMPDDNGSLDGYHSILANFSLEGAQEALVQNNHNPIQAFLDCILKSVEKGETKEESKEEEEEKA